MPPASAGERIEPRGDTDKRERRDRQDEVVRGDDPRHGPDRDVEVAEQVREREHDDRRIGKGNGHTRQDDRGGSRLCDPANQAQIRCCQSPSERPASVGVSAISSRV